MQRLLSYRLANLQGVGARGRQEDSFVVANAFDVMKIKEEGLLFAVCDGMGGMADGALASQTAVASLRSSFQSMDRTGDLAVQLKDAIFTASSEIEAKIGGDGGSTVVMGIVYNEKLYYASVGDSFLFLLRNGNLVRMNREQNLCHQRYAEEIREGSVNPKDYQEQKEASALTCFLGMIGLDDIDCSVRPFPLRDGDVLLACSDGVGGVLMECDIKEALSLSGEQDICRYIEQRLVDYNQPNQDNYTALVVKCLY
ncbi:MAG: serine/threonine-protein phosphatase [Lachnospiraceae bacterium]|nr:serine/threonine-protein phosphatase [Lachnospiraceae bacterium]